MLERLARARDIHGLPRTTIRSPVEFFDDLEADATDLRTVVGELYFELHRGTYTSQAAVKRGNRRGEGALHDAELLAALAGAEYPREELRGCGRRCCSTSSTTSCRARRSARSTPARRPTWPRSRPAPTRSARRCSARATSRSTRAPFARREVAERRRRARVRRRAPVRCGRARRRRRASAVERRDGDGRPRQRAPDRGDRARRHGQPRASPAAARRSRRPPTASSSTRTSPPPGTPGTSTPPTSRRARTSRPRTGSASIDEHPLRAEVVFERGWIAQRIRLDAGSRRLEFDTEVDWRFDHRFLKVAFPLAVHAPEATYEVAFGAVRRPTHYSSRLDLATLRGPRPPLGRPLRARLRRRRPDRLQVRLQRRSATRCGSRSCARRAVPTRRPTVGRHAFTYALLPHAGGWQDGGVVEQAIALNSPIRFGAVSPGSLASVDGGLVLDTVKRAEDSDALVLRLYEPHGARGVCRIRVPGTQAHRANLLEEPGDALEVEGGDFLLPFRPWEIVTLTVL